jgi:hypothetical protein
MGRLGMSVFVFIDDILVCSNTLQEHVDHLRKVFQALNKANIRLKRKKCSFCRPSVDYLGHCISKDGVALLNSNVAKVLAMGPPQNRDEFRSLLGAAGYYRRFLPELAATSAPLNALLKKEIPFVWGKEQQMAFEHLQRQLASPPLLTYPNEEYVQILSVDASYQGLGAILSQSPDGKKEDEKVIAYASKAL